jgi:hypothetical protein
MRAQPLSRASAEIKVGVVKQIAVFRERSIRAPNTEARVLFLTAVPLAALPRRFSGLTSKLPVNHPQSAANTEGLTTYEGCNGRSVPMPGIGFNLLC